MSYIVFEAVVCAQSCVKRCFVSASRASSLRFTTVGDIRQAWKGDECHRDSIGSDCSTWEGRKVGIAVNSADSIEAILYIALRGLNFIQGLSSRKILWGTIYAFKLPPPTHRHPPHLP